MDMNIHNKLNAPVGWSEALHFATYIHFNVYYKFYNMTSSLGVI